VLGSREGGFSGRLARGRPDRKERRAAEIHRKGVFAHTWIGPAERQTVLAHFSNPLRTVKDRHLTALSPRNLVRG
jgi:hypothetical protein